MGDSIRERGGDRGEKGSIVWVKTNREIGEESVD